jgi:hypothetical protein
MLLFSLTMHGFVLLIPLSLYKETKYQSQTTTAAELEATLPSIASTPHSTELFSEDKTLVKPQTSINPQFTAQLPSLPPGTIIQTSENLPLIPTVATPQVSPTRNPIPEVTLTPASVAISKKNQPWEIRFHQSENGLLSLTHPSVKSCSYQKSSPEKARCHSQTYCLGTSSNSTDASTGITAINC